MKEPIAKESTSQEPAAAAQRPRLGVLLERLERIRRELDREDLELEDQLALYREGCQLAEQAKSILDEATAEVEMLSKEPE